MLHAVFVGIDEYQDDRIGDLAYASADATEFSDLVATRIETSERNVRLLLNDQATKQKIMIAIGEDLPRNVGQGDVVLLYFAGHGSPELCTAPDTVSRYIVTHDTQYDSIYATGIDMEREFRRWFERLDRASLVLLIADTCFSGRSGGRTFQGPNLRQSSFRSVQLVSLEKLDLGEGRLMIAACDDDEVAHESSRLNHGVFTYHLIEALKEPRSEGIISVQALYDRVSQDVRAYTNGQQAPILNGRSRAAQFPALY